MPVKPANKLLAIVIASEPRPLISLLVLSCGNMIHEEPVCADPKLFIGGLRFDVGREDIFNHFSQYGPIKNCVLLKHQDTGKSKGCAMVLYTKWANAEAALNAENGTASNLSGPRQLIVKFADPQRRQEDGVLVGVTPRKLFVGQVLCHVLMVLCLGCACSCMQCAVVAVCLVTWRVQLQCVPVHSGLMSVSRVSIQCN